MRWSVLVGLVVVGVADAAPGKQKGASLSEEDEPVAVKPAAAGPHESDLALLRGLLWALEPAPTEIRVIAVEDLGLLGDPRALNPLAELLIDPNPAVQSAALKSIAALRYPRSEEILTNVARHPTLPERLKVSAVDAVLYQNTRSAIAFLKQVARSTTFTFNLQNAAKRALAEVPPDRIEASR
ncbi:MAG: fruC [Myxococcaceae bacterium]|nr:fruC [Myxococcaceae bacterium]